MRSTAKKGPPPPKRRAPAKKAAAPREGIFAHYLALYERLTRRVARVVTWRGRWVFPKGGAEKWRAKKHAYETQSVGAILEELERDTASGTRYVDVRAVGEAIEIVGWDWRSDWERLNHTIANLLEAAAPLAPKGNVEVFAREDDGSCRWVSYAFRGKKLEIDEGDTRWDAKKMQAALEAVAPFIEDWLAAHPEAKLRHKRAGLHGYVDRTGREVIAPELERAYEFSDGIASVQEKGRARLLDREGRMLPGRFFLTDSFLRGLAPVAVAQDEYGYVDQTGSLRIPAQFRRAEPFRGPLAVVRTGTVLVQAQRWLTLEGELASCAHVVPSQTQASVPSASWR